MLRATPFAKVVLLLSAYAAITWAQSTYGSFVGSIVDPAGAAVPDAIVTATNRDTTARRSTLGDATGNFTLVNLEPGVYEITVEAKGFSRALFTNLGLGIAANHAHQRHTYGGKPDRDCERAGFGGRRNHNRHFRHCECETGQRTPRSTDCHCIARRRLHQPDFHAHHAGRRTNRFERQSLCRRRQAQHVIGLGGRHQQREPAQQRADCGAISQLRRHRGNSRERNQQRG